MEKQVCQFCEKQVVEEYNFCPYCGEPLNAQAKQLLNEKLDIAKLEQIKGLIELVQDQKTLLMLKDIATKISEK